MTISRILMLSGIALWSAGWLMADPVLPDGHLGLHNGGCCSIPVTGEGGVGFGDNEVSANGGGTFTLANQTGFVIKKFDVTLEVSTFEQVFVCVSELFLFCDISGNEETGLVTFSFHGIGTGDQANNTCNPDGVIWSCLDGGGSSADDPGGINGAGDFTLDLNNPGGCDNPSLLNCGGFTPLSTPQADVPTGGLGDPLPTPEPGTFALLLTTGGVMLAGRKFRRR